MREDYRLYTCGRCRALVSVCSRCDRGQVYCGRECSTRARQASLREAGRRHQSTPRGRQLHAARQARYLMRVGAKMTHQCSPETSCAPTLPPAALLRLGTSRCRAAEPETVRCGFCGSPCRPYGRWSFRRRRP